MNNTSGGNSVFFFPFFLENAFWIICFQSVFFFLSQYMISLSLVADNYVSDYNDYH